MLMNDAPEFGIYREDRGELRRRCLVSVGLEMLEPEVANSRGYLVSGEAEIIVPAIAPRLATNQELDAIIARPGTKRLMQLCRLPIQIGEQLLQGCHMETEGFDEQAPYQEIAPGIRGRYAETRLDMADQLTVSVDPATPHPITGRPSKVGNHMDTWRNPNLSLLIGNAGPGERWHHITPAFNRDTANGPSRADRVRFMQEHPDPSSLLTYWVKLEPPTATYIEALLNSPVAWAMHDGSTLDCPEPSTAFFCAIDPVEPGTYPSPLVPRSNHRAK